MSFSKRLSDVFDVFAFFSKMFLESLFWDPALLTGSVILEFMQAATELFGKRCLLQFEEPSWKV